MFTSGDKPLKEALKLMNSEGVSSLAVVDNQFNVVGNISNADVKVIRPYSQLPRRIPLSPAANPH
jgi:CBS domain-containing protein